MWPYLPKIKPSLIVTKFNQKTNYPWYVLESDHIYQTFSHPWKWPYLQQQKNRPYKVFFYIFTKFPTSVIILTTDIFCCCLGICRALSFTKNIPFFSFSFRIQNFLMYYQIDDRLSTSRRQNTDSDPTFLYVTPFLTCTSFSKSTSLNKVWQTCSFCLNLVLSNKEKREKNHFNLLEWNHKIWQV